MASDIYGRPLLRLDPIITPILIVAATAVSVGVQVNAAQKAKDVAKRSGRERAAQLRMDADLERVKSKRLLARQRAQFGAAGVAGPQGSPLLVQTQALIDSIRDRERILAGARFVERDARRQGDAAFTAGISGGVDTAIQGISAVSAQFATPAAPAAPVTL